MKKPKKQLSRKDALWLEMVWQSIPESKRREYAVRHSGAIALIEKTLKRPMVDVA